MIRGNPGNRQVTWDVFSRHPKVSIVRRFQSLGFTEFHPILRQVKEVSVYLMWF